jgi:hypothetical protein
MRTYECAAASRVVIHPVAASCRIAERQTERPNGRISEKPNHRAAQRNPMDVSQLDGP